jgi:hypothetical protein
MEIEKFLEWAAKLEKRKKGKKEDQEKFRRLFERFHLINRTYLDKESFEKAQESVSSMAEAMANTIRYLDAEVVRLRSKRMKLPVENVELAEMQKVQARNAMLLNEYQASQEE